MFVFNSKTIQKKIEKGFNNYKGKTLEFTEFRTNPLLWVRVNGSNSTYELTKTSDINKVVECLKKEVDNL